MKKLMLVCSLCVLAAVLAPVGTASAAEFVGDCTISGEATFWEDEAHTKAANLPKEGTKVLYLHLASVNTTLEPTLCTGAIAKVPQAEVAAVAEGNGKGNLGCRESNGTGTGKVEAAGQTANFEFEFTGVGPLWVFTMKDGKGSVALVAVGFAADKNGVTCATPAGPHGLKFTAQAIGKIE